MNELEYTLPIKLKENIQKVIIGKEDVINKVILAFLAGGHVLLEDVPGVGKTLLAKALAKSIKGVFKRVQCTPDLLPSDITGINIFDQKTGNFEFVPGPVFSNVLLVDEINRATPRTQSSLLEAMEEFQVSVDGNNRELPKPFFVIATQNPAELYGTFPLPGSQMDRFFFSLSIGYPALEDERNMLIKHKESQVMERNLLLGQELDAVLTLEDVNNLQNTIFKVHVSPEIEYYILRLITGTRSDSRINLGGSPRASIIIMRAAQSHAFLEKRNYVIPDDVKIIAPYVLSHRLMLSHGFSRKQAEVLIDEILKNTPVET